MDSRKQDAEELVRRASESLDRQQRRNETADIWGLLYSRWTKADTDQKVLYCFLVAAAFLVIVITPILVISQMFSSDRADKKLVASLSGEQRLEFSYTWVDLNGNKTPRQNFITAKAHLRTEHSRKGWTIEFFGKKWKGKTSELNEMSIACPFADVFKRASELEFGKVSPKAVLQLKVVKGTFRITGGPRARAQYEGSYTEINDDRGQKTTSGSAPPSDAVIKSRYTNSDLFGKTETRITYEVSARAGFGDFKCVLIPEQGEGQK